MRYIGLVLGLCLVVSTGAFAAEETEKTDTSFLDAVTKGTFKLNLRYRYEGVDQDGFDDNGRASTLRTMAGYRTGTWKGFEAYVEFEDVHDVGLSSDHNNKGAGSLWNGVTDRPVIADPADTQINQAYIGWKPVDDLSIRIGMQEVVIDNARFVGNVGWRQNHQSFEAARIDYNGFGNLKLGYTYIDRQRNIFGGSAPMGTSHFSVGYTFDGVGTLKGYGLILDYDDPNLTVKNTSTYGIFFDGAAKLSDTMKLSYRLEYANQEDVNNPGHISADYYRAHANLGFGNMNFGAGYEVLGGSAEDGQFNTPLATLHGYNGWADKFLSTPTNGLEDLFVSAAFTFGRFKLLGVYHDFSADTGGASLGTEFDASVVYTSPWKQKFALKFADYSADEHATDTTKLWIWTSWGF